MRKTTSELDSTSEFTDSGVESILSEMQSLVKSKPKQNSASLHHEKVVDILQTSGLCHPLNLQKDTLPNALVEINGIPIGRVLSITQRNDPMHLSSHCTYFDLTCIRNEEESDESI
jgi:hypothetical protein